MADFDDVDVPEVPATFKTEYEKTYIEYFRLTADHMPPDPNAVPKTEPEPEPSVKIEPYDAEFARNKRFRTERVKLKCRICSEIFESRYAFSRHVLTHEVRCVNCHVKYKTRRELNDHEPHCTRRYGR